MEIVIWELSLFGYSGRSPSLAFVNLIEVKQFTQMFDSGVRILDWRGDVGIRAGGHAFLATIAALALDMQSAFREGYASGGACFCALVARRFEIDGMYAAVEPRHDARGTAFLHSHSA